MCGSMGGCGWVGGGGAVVRPTAASTPPPPAGRPFLAALPSLPRPTHLVPLCTPHVRRRKGGGRDANFDGTAPPHKRGAARSVGRRALADSPPPPPCPPLSVPPIPPHLSQGGHLHGGVGRGRQHGVGGGSDGDGGGLGAVRGGEGEGRGVERGSRGAAWDARSPPQCGTPFPSGRAARARGGGAEGRRPAHSPQARPANHRRPPHARAPPPPSLSPWPRSPAR